MYPEVLRDHIRKCKQATDKPFGVNVPLLYPDIEQHLQILVDEGVKIVFTSAGNPAKYTGWLKERGMTVVHVVANTKFAKKCVDAGVDAIVAEGFEAGGHNGREETTTMCLIPMIVDCVTVPVIAAGGIGCGRTMAAAMCLGAAGVQVGSRFAASTESSAHAHFKAQILAAVEGSTELTLKEITPVRLLKNPFYEAVMAAYEAGADAEALKSLLGRGRAKRGMFEGDMVEGELEIGQISARLDRMETAAEIVADMMRGYKAIAENSSFFQY
jgi:enoyl-[acyl-carrier protein] reductase II